jgi:glutathione S-transferase
MPTLVIANKLYSSWSMRPWLLMKHLGIAFEEIVIPLDQTDTNDRIRRHSPAGKVPILIDGEVTVWETIAIMEYVAETYSSALWPVDPAARAMARSVAAEMHAGFQALRAACPMNLGKKFPARDRGGAVARDVVRVEQIFREARQRFGTQGPFLFGKFTAADAMFAPVVTRLATYSVPVEAPTSAYMDTILSLPAYREWLQEALKEPWVLAHDEVDEEPVEVYRRVA